MYCWLNVGLVAVCPNISFLNLFDSSIPHVCWIVQYSAIRFRLWVAVVMQFIYYLV